MGKPNRYSDRSVRPSLLGSVPVSHVFSKKLGQAVPLAGPRVSRVRGKSCSPYHIFPEVEHRSHSLQLAHRPHTTRPYGFASQLCEVPLTGGNARSLHSSLRNRNTASFLGSGFSLSLILKGFEKEVPGLIVTIHHIDNRLCGCFTWHLSHTSSLRKCRLAKCKAIQPKNGMVIHQGISSTRTSVVLSSSNRCQAINARVVVNQATIRNRFTTAPSSL